MLIHDEIFLSNPVILFPTQLDDSLVEQRTSSALHFPEEKFIAMLSLKGCNLNRLTINRLLLISLNNVSIQ